MAPPDENFPAPVAEGDPPKPESAVPPVEGSLGRGVSTTPPGPSLGRRLRDRIVRTYLTADLRSLAAGRIFMAAILLLDLVKRWAQVNTFYTNEGLIPNHTLLWRPSFDPVFSFFYMASYTHEAVLLFIICALAYAMLLIGFHTKLAQVASMICLMSLHGRLLLFDNGGDVVLGLVCIWSTFLPTGRVWSVDAVLARRRTTASERPVRVAESFPVPDPDRSFASLAAMALLFQLAFIYFFNAIHKGGPTWREGSAVHYTLHLDRLATWFAVWLRNSMSPGVARLLTWSALATEAVLPIFLLSPFAVRASRRLAILLVIGLHTGFAMCLNLGVFVPAMLAYTPYLVPGADWDALARWWARGPRRARLWTRLTERAASAIERAAALLTPGRRITVSEPGPLAMRILRLVPVAREFTVVLFIFVAGNQLLDENHAAHSVWDHHNSRPVAAAVTYLNLFQGWSMFAPDAPTTDFNIIVEAVTVDGRHVDPFNEVANPRYPNPGRSVPERMGPSWLFYGYENHLPSQPAYYQALQEWILRYPQRTGRPNDQIVSFEVLVVEDDSPPLEGPQVPRNLRTRSLLKYPLR
jgi:hypothetical protein